MLDGSKSSIISILALLAESDAPWPARLASHVNFYPRSPCGERLIALFDFPIVPVISILALLAESDSMGLDGRFKL